MLGDSLPWRYHLVRMVAVVLLMLLPDLERCAIRVAAEWFAVALEIVIDDGPPAPTIVRFSVVARATMKIGIYSRPLGMRPNHAIQHHAR